MSESDRSRQESRLGRRSAATVMLYRVVGTLMIALLAWMVLGVLVLGLMGWMFGWGGHPAIPSVSIEVYFIVYVIVLPIICLFGGWKATRLIESRLNGV